MSAFGMAVAFFRVGAITGLILCPSSIGKRRILAYFPVRLRESFRHTRAKAAMPEWRWKSEGPFVCQQRSAERFKQYPVAGIGLWVVFGMPLDAERKRGCIGHADRFDRAVFCYTFDDDPMAGFENALAVQRVNTDRCAAEELREKAARAKTHFVPVRKYDLRVGVDFPALKPWRSVVHAPRQVANLRMQCSTECDVHFLKPSTDS
jgi:hypothetical protein